MNTKPTDHCQLCAGEQETFKIIDDIPYYECRGCGLIVANRSLYYSKITTKSKVYDDNYWKSELSAARERSYGSSLQRVAEVFLYSRIKINSFLDLGSGPGLLLDALALLLPNSKEIFHGVELYPPRKKFRSKHPNYHIGSLDNLNFKFDAGVCIEVIEHLFPDDLELLISNLSKKLNKGAIFLFNSGQPEYVKKTDPDYLDPMNRGHISSYSIDSLRIIFEKYNFSIYPLPGRDWAFLAIFGNNEDKESYNAESLLNLIWHPLPENISVLKDKEFGPLMFSMGIESARCYLESAICQDRTRWALSFLSRQE